MLQLIYELRKNCCGTGGRVDGRKGGEIEGSTRGPHGPKNPEANRKVDGTKKYKDVKV